MPHRKAEQGLPQQRLAPYRGKRDFARTPEPSGGGSASDAADAPRFVVQRHRASRLHYDLRFEMAGVLASWAVPKGPTLDPGAKRMAVHVEDHPIEYLEFEGVIPKGEYGGGDVIVWDTGTWELVDDVDPADALARGELHAEVHGHKLRGRLVLVRRGAGQGEHEQWLLLHKRDAFAVDGWDPEDHPRSVLSGRTNDEVAADPEFMWHSDLPADRAAVRVRPAGPTTDELAALDAFGTSGTWSVFGRDLRITNLDKELFPANGTSPALTKRDLIRYAAQIAPVALPYLSGRALNMRRHPNGAQGKGFWHKQAPQHAPDWITRWDYPDAGPGETSTYLVIDEPAALVWAANFGTLEWHAWTSRTEAPHLPTYVLLDIDPGERTAWPEVLQLALLHRDALRHLKVRGYPKLTGGRGVHVWIPVGTPMTFDDTRAWAETLSRTIGAVVPELVSWRWQVRERGGLARLDYTQNAVNKTLVAPYSPRAAPGAPVSAPITWDQLDDPDLRPDTYRLGNVLDSLAERGDPFRGVLDPQPLPVLR